MLCILKYLFSKGILVEIASLGMETQRGSIIWVCLENTRISEGWKSQEEKYLGINE
jgi:hypothetical protein